MLEGLEHLYSTAKLQLRSEELKLLDWILHYPMPNSGVDIEWHMQLSQLREAIWRLLLRASQPPTTKPKPGEIPSIPVYELAISEQEARILLAILPTTFHWAESAEDWGFSLKVKIYQFLLTLTGEGGG